MIYDYDRRGKVARVKELALRGSERNSINKLLNRAGLDGNGRFRKPGEALTAAQRVLREFNLDFDGMVDGFFLSKPQGRHKVNLVMDDGTMGAIPVQNVLTLSWQELDNGRYEVIAYVP
jgi:hypothetical protein